MTLTSDRSDERLTNDELRSLFLFEALTDEQLSWLGERGWVVSIPAGATVLDEGDAGRGDHGAALRHHGDAAQVGRDDVEVVRTDQRGVYAGAMQSYVERHGPQKYTATVSAITDVRLWVIRSEDFADAVRTWFPMAIHLLEGLFLGMRNSQELVGQRQQLLALGRDLRRPDPRAQQPGGRGGARHRGAQGPGGSTCAASWRCSRTTRSTRSCWSCSSRSRKRRCSRSLRADADSRSRSRSARTI